MIDGFRSAAALVKESGGAEKSRRCPTLAQGMAEEQGETITAYVQSQCGP